MSKLQFHYRNYNIIIETTVDYIPPGCEVVGAAVLVLEIVGVLPDVIEDDGIEALSEGRAGDDL